MSEHYLKQELYKRFETDHQIIDFLQEVAFDGIWYWDLEKPENEWMSAKFWETLGYNPKHKKHEASEWKELIFPSDLTMVEENLKKHLENPESSFDQIVRYKHRNSTTVWVRCRGLAIRDSNGKPIRILGTHNDVTSLMKSHTQINRLKNEYETVFNGTQDALFLIKVEGHRKFRFIRNNQSHQIKTGISQTMIDHKSPSELLGEEAAEAVINHYQECVDRHQVTTYEEELSLPVGNRIWHTTLTPIIEEGKVVNIVGSAVDITEQKLLEQELEKRANFDFLTNLANRDYLTRALDECTGDIDNQFVFIFIDLDDYKDVNDNYGHAAGDQVLKEVANRLLKITSEKDLVSRLGGDEFVIIKCDITKSEDINVFKHTIMQVISQPIHYQSIQLHVSASLGYSIFPHHGLNYDELSRHADKDMYKMKQNKKNH